MRAFGGEIEQAEAIRQRCCGTVTQLTSGEKVQYYTAYVRAGTLHMLILWEGSGEEICIE